GNGSNQNGNSSIDPASLTLAPDECQADLVVLRTEDFEERDHPLTHKGKFFDYRDVPSGMDTELALVDLSSDTVVALNGQNAPGIADTTINLFGSRLAVAPDLGLDNDPDFPLVFTATIIRNFVNRQIMIYSDGASNTALGFQHGQTFSFSGGSVTINRVTRFAMSPSGEFIGLMQVEEFDDELLVLQRGPGAPIVPLLFEGQPLPADPVMRFVESIDLFSVQDNGSVAVWVQVDDGTGTAEGFALLAIDLFTGITQCSATDTSILCNGGVLLSEGVSAEPDESASDGATFGVVLREPGTARLEYKVIGEPTTQVLDREAPEIQELGLNSFGRVRVCSLENSLYFAGQIVFADGLGVVDELFRIDESGELTQLTDFRSLIADESLEGEVPDEIRDFALGYNCDAILYTWG
ncbi:MAG: hypothetical protein AAFY60_18215, partial [Myxococcota bacterium]